MSRFGIDERPYDKRAHLLLVLQSRAVVYAEVTIACNTLRELLLAFLDGGGYSGAGYGALRAHSQRKLAHLVQSALEHARGPLALVESGAPLLVPVSRRLAKKLGDLVQIVFVLFDWQPAASSASSSSSSSSLLGASHVHGSGHGAHFASDLIGLEAFSHGLVFEPQQDSSSGGGGGGGGEEDGKRTLHHMRLLTAAIHSYLSGLSGGGGGSVAPAAAAAGEGSSDAAPAATTASETLTSMRERLSLALVRGRLEQASGHAVESRFAVMRTSSAPSICSTLCVGRISCSRQHSRR